MRRSPIWFALIVGVLCATASALPPPCDVDWELAGSSKIRGSIRPAAQCESFVVDVPRLAVVSATAKASGAGAPIPQIELTADGSGTSTQGTPISRGAKLSATAGASGVQRLRVTGDGAAVGDYALTLTVKPHTPWNLGGAADAGVENTASFAAPAGASARVKLTRPRGSAFVPNLVAIDGPDGFTAPLAGGGASGLVPLGGTGEYVVRFAGGAGGTWTARIDVVAPRAAAKSVDLTDAALTGDRFNATAAYARVVGPAGGTVAASVVGGSSCTLPPNAVSAPTLVSIAGGRPFVAGAGVHAAGPFVRIVAASGQFLGPVTMAVPYDPEQFQDATAEMTVYCKDDSGGAPIAAAKPYDFGTAGVVKITTSLMGTLIATTTRPRAVTGAWKLVRFSNDAQDGYIGSVTCTISDAAATPGHLDVTAVAGARSTWTPSAADAAGAVSEQILTTTSGALTVVDDATVTFADAAASRTLTFARGFGDDCLVSAGRGKSAVTGVDVPQLDMLLRDAGPPSAADMPGRYNFFLLSAGGASRPTGKVLLSTRQVAGTAVLDATGHATFSMKGGHEALSDFPLDPSGWTEDAAAKIPAGTWSVAGSAAHLGFAVGGVASVDLYPVMRNTAFVGVVGAATGSGSEIGFLFLAREASGRAPTQLDGTNPVVSVFEALRERVVNDQGYGIPMGSGTAVRTATTVDMTIPHEFAIEHDLTTGEAFGIDDGGAVRHAAFQLTASGRYTDPGSGLRGENVVGFVTARGDVLFQTNAGDHFIWALIELPSVAPQ